MKFSTKGHTHLHVHPNGPSTTQEGCPGQIDALSILIFSHKCYKLLEPDGSRPKLPGLYPTQAWVQPYPELNNFDYP